MPNPQENDHPLRKIDVQGRSRSYLLFAPRSHDPSLPTPLVMVFHGGGTNPSWVRWLSGMSEKAEQEGFLVVYPSGTGLKQRRLSWNCGPRSGYERWVGGPEEAQHHRVDEVAFVQAILDDLRTIANIDARRVYACGISTGAILCYFLASRMAQQIAAIAPLGGPMGEATCHPSRPVPLIHFHGTEDEFAPYHGGTGVRSFTGMDFYSVPYTIETWRKANRCLVPPRIERLPQHQDPTYVERSLYTPREDGAETQLYTIVGGGHTWPGQDPRTDIMGAHVRDLDANQLIWQFFQDHPLPERYLSQ